MAQLTPRLAPRLQATSHDTARIYQVLVLASAWLQARGLSQWNPVYPLKRFSRDVEAGHVWYWDLNGAVVATITLLTERPDYYPEHVWSYGRNAWYVCRFAVSRSVAGQGIGARALDEVESDASTAHARVRLDVSAANPFLEQYYAQRGYRRVAQADIKGAPALFLERFV